MNTAAILLVIQGIEAAIAAAPGVIDVVTKGKDLVTALFTAKVITAEVQNTLHNYIDARAALVVQGIIPAHWKVEPDPVA